MAREFREPDIATRQKQSLKKQGALNYNYGKPRDEETKQKISDKMKAYWSGIPSKNSNENC